jgi:hypothetical protein
VKGGLGLSTVMRRFRESAVPPGESFAADPFRIESVRGAGV